MSSLEIKAFVNSAISLRDAILSAIQNTEPDTVVRYDAVSIAGALREGLETIRQALGASKNDPDIEGVFMAADALLKDLCSREKRIPKRGSYATDNQFDSLNTAIVRASKIRVVMSPSLGGVPRNKSNSVTNEFAKDMAEGEWSKRPFTMKELASACNATKNELKSVLNWIPATAMYRPSTSLQGRISICYDNIGRPISDKLREIAAQEPRIKPKSKRIPKKEKTRKTKK